MTSDNWLALFFAGVVSVATYMIATCPKDEGPDNPTEEEPWW